MRRVQLFSTPRHRQAPMTHSEPRLKTRTSPASVPRIMLAATTRKTAHHSRPDIFSRKTATAIPAVATISKLFSSDTLAAVVLATPNSNRIGAAMSSTTIATVYGRSRFPSEGALPPLPQSLRTSIIPPMPVPAPRYKNPASMAGEIPCIRILDSGTWTAYRVAARIAKSTAVLFFSILLPPTPNLHAPGASPRSFFHHSYYFPSCPVSGPYCQPCSP